MTNNERRDDRYTVIVAPRDTFTRLENCLQDVFIHTRSPIDVICLAGGAPSSIQERLKHIYGDKVRFIFKEEFMTNAQLRNIGLREARTRLAVCLDSDAFVRPGWFEPLLECYRQTGAALVVPIILDRQNLIHTAGNSLYITEERGHKYGAAELRYANLPVRGPTNIPRQEVDFAEVHCHFVEVETALDLEIYDENLREGHDYDSGLTLTRAGKKIMLEPRSFVYLHIPRIQDRLEDIPLYRWKWDLKAVLEAFKRIENKWGIDLVSKSNMRAHIIMLNHRVGFWTRLYPSTFSIWVDRFNLSTKDRLSNAMTSWRRFINWTLGLDRA
jgi:hypothetical protein